MTTPMIEKMARAIKNVPDLSVYDTGQDEWHVFYRDEGGEVVVVAEACNQYEAEAKCDAYRPKMAAKAALTALLEAYADMIKAALGGES